MTASLLEAALAYAARGWPVFPCAPGAKTPASAHGFKDATTDEAQIRAWWTSMPQANIGIATGTPGPDVIDVDVKDDGTGWAALARITAAGLVAGAGELVSTPSGGAHLYFTGTSQRNGRIPGQHLDYRGTGGYVVAPPSAVDGKPYRTVSSGAIIPGPADWRAIRVLLDPPPDPQPFQQPAVEREANRSTLHRPGDDWASGTSWPQILTPHGWRKIRDLGGGRACWCRPGKTGSFTSATTRDDGGLYVFSTSTEFESEVPYSKFGAYALLEHHGDHTAAAAQLRRDGYGEQPPAIMAASFQQPADSQDDAEQPAHSSWYPRDLGPILDGDAASDPLPAFLARDDGLCLIYRDKINALIGESESGKTWIALTAAKQALTAGQQVLYLDFEDAAPAITGRLQALGATRDQLAKQFRYIAPDERLTALAAADLSAVLADPVPDLIILDGVNAAMTMLGLNLKDNKDATEFTQQILKPLKRTGAAVLTVDHVTKDREGRGSYAIGAQAKRADIDGAAFIVEAVRKFGRGQQGKLKLTVSKDRPGHVRAISTGATYAGMAILTPHDDGSITVEINAPDTRPADEKPKWRPTGFMERVSILLEHSDDGESKRAVRAGVKGGNEHIDVALDRLTEEGYITCEPGQKIRSVKPYREVSERQLPDRADRAGTVPDRATRHGQGGASATVPTVPRESDVVTPGTVARGTPRSNAGTENVPPCLACGERHPPGPCYQATG